MASIVERAVARQAQGYQLSVFGADLGSSSWILRIQAGCGHDGASEFFGRNGESFGWRLPSGIFFGGGRDEAIAPANYGLQILRFGGVVTQGASDLAYGGIDSLLDIDEHILAPQFAGDLLARDQLPPPFDQEHE